MLESLLLECYKLDLQEHALFKLQAFCTTLRPPLLLHTEGDLRTTVHKLAGDLRG